MWKRLLLILALTGAIAPAYATDYTDLWWIPAESGWGVNFTHSDNFIFATMFVYEVDGTPTWVVAELTRTPVGTYFGPVFATTGPYFGATPYDRTLLTSPQVGTATFRPAGPATGDFDYSVRNVFVSKIIQRQTMVPAALEGVYFGGLGMTLTGCDDPERNRINYTYASFFVDRYSANEIQIDVGSDSGWNCAFRGTLVQEGMVNQVPEATYTCNDGLRVIGTVSELRRTSLGIEGRWSAPVSEGCRQDVSFSGVRR